MESEVCRSCYRFKLCVGKKILLGGTIQDLWEKITEALGLLRTLSKDEPPNLLDHKHKYPQHNRQASMPKVI